MKKHTIIEVCVDSVESAIIAQNAGAHRVELCDNLKEGGGTTPSYAAIKLARKKLIIDLYIIVRPRAGDFHYSEIEMDIIREDILQAKKLGVDGIVIGALNMNGKVNVEITQKWVELARPMSVTFHRVFDMTCDAFEAMETLIEIGVDRILTSGQQNKVIEATALISDLVSMAKNRIIIMPGGGIDENNIQQIVDKTGVKECHVYTEQIVKSKMIYRNNNPKMGGLADADEYQIRLTDGDKIKLIIKDCNL